MSDDITQTPDYSLVEFDLEAFKARADKISVDAISTEVLKWTVVHVEDYLDNRQNIFRLYFPKDTLEGMPEMTALHELYQFIPELPQDHPQEDLTVQALQHLHAITARVRDRMNQEKDLKDELFNRLIFYYDTKIRKSGNTLTPIIYDLEGYVHIGLFDYEAFSQKVEVRRGTAQGDQPMQGVEKIKEIVLPEGYVVEFTLHFWPKAMTTSFGL